MAALEKVNVVRGDEAEPELFRQTRHYLVALLLRLDPVVVHFQEKIFRAQDVAKLGDALARLGQVVRLDRHVDFAFEAAAQPDQTGRMLGEKLLVNSRLVMKSVEMSG